MHKKQRISPPYSDITEKKFIHHFLKNVSFPAHTSNVSLKVHLQCTMHIKNARQLIGYYYMFNNNNKASSAIHSQT